MSEELNYELALRHQAWNEHFKEKKKTKMPKFKQKNNKYKTNWIKQKDENDLFEKWVPVKTPNEKYDSAQESANEQLTPEPKSVKKGIRRRSSRITIQNFLYEDRANLTYKDPSSSEFSFSESDNAE